jgi:phosphatidylglycerol lysyltransferase
MASIEERAQARAIAAAVPAANPALLADKRLLFDATGRACIQYQIRGRSWVSLAGPLGPPATHAALVAHFIALCARHGGRPVFYRIDAASLPLYASFGLRHLKIGEEARVALNEGDALDGPLRRKLRRDVRRAERAGCAFALVPPDQVAAFLPALAVLSDAWIRAKGGREKGFSLSAFRPEELCRSALAVVSCHGRPVAFANVWGTANGAELVPDLMRRDPAGPDGAMDFLFTQLMQWGAAHGHSWLNLGIAPLARCEGTENPAPWRILARLTTRHGARYYNFEGVRHFKAKFAPVWRPSYMACRGGLATPLSIVDVACLIAGRR